MENFVNRWDEKHTEELSKPIVNDGWLDKYKSIITNTKTKVLELGCGRGYDTQYLLNLGVSVIASDYSDVALNMVKKQNPKAEVMKADLLKQLPFQDNSFDIIIADLCLHYFDKKTTFKVLKEIKRIMNTNGYLIARVNSVNDVYHGAGNGELIEENLYYVDGYNKRFFSIEDAKIFFETIGKVDIIESETIRRNKPKYTIEILAKKI